MIYNIYYTYFIIFIYLIKILNAVVVENENEIIDYLSKSNYEVTLQINSEINIIKEININSSIKKLSIIGNSIQSSIINLKNPLHFDSNIKEIEIKNIIIYGNLFFNNNEKITIDTVNLNGYIDSDFNKINNNDVEITNLTYKPTVESVENCINLSGNIKINKSNFYGSSSCRNRLLHYDGFNKYTFDIKECNFDGEYECPFLNIQNALYANIETSYFEKGYSSRYIDGGVGVKATSSYVNVQNCTFNDILSYNNGGAFNFYNNYNVNGSNLNFNNVTSLGMGSIFQIYSSEQSLFKFYNITQKNTGNISNMRDGGLIMSIEGKAIVDILSYYAENLINTKTSGSAFVLSNSPKLTMKDVYIKKLKGSGNSGGLFYTADNSVDIEFIANNITLYDLYQSSRHTTAIIDIPNKNKAYMDGVKIFNSGGYNTIFIHMSEDSYANLSNFEVDNFKSYTIREFVKYDSTKNFHYFYEEDKPKNTISNFKVSNVKSQGVLFFITNGIFNINDCEFSNIHECYKYNNCVNIVKDEQYVQNTELYIGYGGEHTQAFFTNIKIDKMYGEVGTRLFLGKATITNVTVTNSYFKNGFIYMNELNIIEKYYENGIYTISESKFENNTSESGTIFNFSNLSPGKYKFIKIINCEFINNTASRFGGVIYSIGEHNHEGLFFQNCTYYNNHAKFGNIMYAHARNRLPRIGVLDPSELSTIPEYFEMYGKIVEKISILSGESVPEGIQFKLYDGFDNQMFFPKETSNFQFEDLVLFDVEINDTYNARVLGQTKDYCFDETCTLPPVIVVGNPGNYKLSLKFKSFGIYPNFVQDSIDIDLKIRNCNEKTHLNLVVYEDTNLKSCYIPICKNECKNDGVCVNNDLCDCSNSTFGGNYCDEYIRLERNSSIDMLLNIVILVIIFIIVVIIGMTLYYRDNSIIKGGGIEFLIIILIGLIINNVKAIFLTFKRTTKLCYQTYLLSNVGFSLVFGSIFVKTYRIYNIFCKSNKINRGLKKSIMFLIIALITLFHCTMAFMWYFFESVTVTNDYTADNKEFVKCEYPKSKKLSTLFNFVLLMVEFVFSYFIRRVEKIYKEALVIPAYVYIVYMFLMYTIEEQAGINIIIQDQFDIAGTIISTIVCVFYLFIIKFEQIFKKKLEHKVGTYVKISDCGIKCN